MRTCVARRRPWRGRRGHRPPERSECRGWPCPWPLVHKRPGWSGSCAFRRHSWPCSLSPPSWAWRGRWPRRRSKAPTRRPTSAMRLASVLLGVLTVGLTWLLAAEVTPRIWVRFVAAAFVALHPQLTFIGATINPDALLAAASTAFVLVAVQLVRRGPSPRRMLA